MKSGKLKLSELQSTKKAVSVIKCFICNQILYSQQSFDQHMHEHSSKLSKNHPQQIQRKTLESFRLKKGADNKNSSANNKKNSAATLQNKITNDNNNKNTVRACSVRLKQQNKLNTNQNIDYVAFKKDKGASMIKKMQKEKEDSKIQKQQFVDDHLNQGGKQEEQISNAMRESTIIINKIEQFTKMADNNIEKEQESSNQIKQFQVETQQQYILSQISEPQFMYEFVSLPETQQQKINILNNIHTVNLDSEQLINYKQQLSYLDQLFKLSKKQQLDIKKIQQIKLRIIDKLQEIAIARYHVSSESKSLEATDLKNNSEYSNIINKEISYCNICYERIQYGDQCYQQQGQNKSTVHTSCWNQQ